MTDIAPMADCRDGADCSCTPRWQQESHPDVDTVFSMVQRDRAGVRGAAGRPLDRPVNSAGGLTVLTGNLVLRFTPSVVLEQFRLQV